VSGATSEETASPASPDHQEDQAAAEHVPATSPLLDEVKQGHPVVAIVVGGVVMGIIGALIALPVAAAIQLILGGIQPKLSRRRWSAEQRSTA
jgi:hypothetical protein